LHPVPWIYPSLGEFLHKSFCAPEEVSPIIKPLGKQWFLIPKRNPKFKRGGGFSNPTGF